MFQQNEKMGMGLGREPSRDALSQGDEYSSDRFCLRMLHECFGIKAQMKTLRNLGLLFFQGLLLHFFHNQERGLIIGVEFQLV